MMFLRKGARYRLLGSSSLPELMGSDWADFASDPSIRKFVLSSDSALREELCNEDANGICQFTTSVILSTSLSCSTDDECKVDTVRVVQVTNNIFYEYMRPACVENVFFNSGIKLSQRYKWMRSTCGNPLLPVASEACCASGSQFGQRNYIYDGERMTYDTALNRCSELGMMTCDYNHVVHDVWYKANNFFWAKVRSKITSFSLPGLIYHNSNTTFCFFLSTKPFHFINLSAEKHRIIAGFA